MNLSVYLAGLLMATLLAGACLVGLLIYYNPFSSQATCLIFSLFYLSLLIGSTGLFTLIGLLLRRLSQKSNFAASISRVMRQLEVSFRQGLFLGGILTTVLILQSQRILVWWHLAGLVVLVGLAEWWLSRR